MEFRKPEHEGQVCRIINPFADEIPEEVYVLVEDPSPFDSSDVVYVVNLNDLQRNIHYPMNCEQLAVAKNELHVIAESLKDYIESWNA